jgi:hypothetical protein
MLYKQTIHLKQSAVADEVIGAQSRRSDVGLRIEITTLSKEKE